MVSVSEDRLLKIDMSDTAPTVEVLAKAFNGLDGPASLAFGTSSDTNQTIYITNFALMSEKKDPGVVTLALTQ